MAMLLKAYRVTIAVTLLALGIVLAVAACNKSSKASSTVFASPDDAGNSLVQAGKSDDPKALQAIFGPNSKEIISSGDAVDDKATVNNFVEAYGVMHRWRKMDDNAQVLLVGADNFAFPIPLRKNGGGQWFFDTAAGKDEILARRIGRNELGAIAVCRALADAQIEYFSQGHDDQFAMKFISDPGKQNGLYWDSPEGQPKSPLGPLVAFASSEGYSAKQNSHAPFHGYYFRMLNKQGAFAQDGVKDYVVDGKMTGGFAFVAYPAEYGNSGVMTFIINQDGVLLQKDLGKTTLKTVTAMSDFDPAAGWTSVGD
jgi:hypothetical protein